MPSSSDAVIDRIRQGRTVGIVTCGCYQRPSGSSEEEAASVIMQSLGFRTPSNGWRRLDDAMALGVVARALHRELAYQAEIMQLRDAELLAAEFAALVPQASAVFTNAFWARSDSQGDEVTFGAWDPVSDSTFDTGVIRVGASMCAVIWMQDED